MLIITLILHLSEAIDLSLISRQIPQQKLVWRLTT